MIGIKLSNRYELLREIGRGGMGVVFLAYDPLLEREVAIKVVTTSLLSAESEERFKREAKVIAKMDHPGIVVVYDVGEHDQSLYFVMPFVRGTNLRTFLENRTLTLGDVVSIGIQVSEALDYSHSQGVIHRDIKPENIMLSREDASSPLRVRVTDFGLAIVASENRLTQSGAMVGTVSYFSPEQISGEEQTGRSDIYSLGTVLYECIVGSTPFVGEIQHVLYRILHENPESPRSRGKQIDEELEGHILRCLEKDPAMRPQRAVDFAQSLFQYRGKLQEQEQSRLILSAVESGPYRRPTMPLIGRKEESAELQRRLVDAINGDCQFVVVSGEPGIGKTRILEETENLALARKVRVLHGRFVEQDRSFPYQGFCEVIQQGFNIRSSGSSRSTDFSDLAVELASLFPVLSDLGETRSSGGSSTTVSRSLLKQQTDKAEDRTYIFELLARAISRIAGGKPLAIFLEDLHAAEVSIEALQYIVRRLGPTPTLVIGTYRTTEADKSHPIVRMLNSFQGDRRFVHLSLPPFTLEEHRVFLESLTGSQHLHNRLVDTVYEATEGNPFFTKELVRSLTDSQTISADTDGIWNISPDASISTESLPATIQKTVEKRLERLPEPLKEILQIAAVLGKMFEFKDIEAMADDRDAEEAIDELIETGFVEEDRESRGARLNFSSVVVRDVLYGQISRRKRKSLHRKYADLLEKRNANKLERVYPQLLHHYSEGDVSEKIIEYGLKLSRKSLETFSIEESLRALRSVLDALEEEGGTPDQEAEARMLLATAYRKSGNADQALKELARAIQIYETLDRKDHLVATMAVAAETAWAGRKVDETKRFIEKGLQLESEKSIRIRLLSLGATVANLRGEQELSQAYLQELEQLQPGSKETGTESLPHGGTVVVAMLHAVQAFYPGVSTLDEEQEILANVFETLVTTDAQGNLMPQLCEQWKSSDESRSFVFTIRSNVRTHQGIALTAPLCKAAFENAVGLAAKQLPQAFTVIHGVSNFLNGNTTEISGIQILSDQVLAIHLQEPLPIYPALLTDARTGIGIKHETPIGTGPFRIASFQAERVLLERNNDYWKSAPPLIDQLEFRLSMTSAQIAAGFRRGEFDLVRDLHPQDYDEVLRDRRLRTGLAEVPKRNVYFAILNGNRPVCNLPAVRKAICGIVRTHDLVRRTLGRSAEPAEGLIPPGILGHDPDRRRYPLIREKIISLLESSKHTPPLRLTAAVHPIFQDRYAFFLKALLKEWSDIGVEVTVATSLMATYLEATVHADQFDLLIGRYIADYNDPDNFTHGFFHSKTGNFKHYFLSDGLDPLMEEGRVETDPLLREKIYRRIETWVADTFCVLPLFHDVDLRLAGPRIRNLSLKTSPPYVNYSEIAKTQESLTARKTEGGIIHVPITGEITSLDPSMVFLVVQMEVIPNIFETLTRETEGARIIPWLVSHFQAEDESRLFRFKLRENVRFQDGKKLTARDVRFTFERLLQNHDSASRWPLTPIRGAQQLMDGTAKGLEGFTILSAYEFIIELEQPLSIFPTLLAYPSAAIVPEAMEEFAGSWREGCVGTGPFRVVRFEPGKRLELEGNPYYWRQEFPRSDGLVYTFSVTPQEILEGFKNSKFSLAWDLFPSDVESLRRESDFASRYGETPRLSTYYAVFNIHKGPLTDEKLRHRLVQSIDVETLVRKTLGHIAIPAHGLIPPGLPGYVPGIRRMPASGSVPEEKIELTAIINSVYDGPYLTIAEELLKTFNSAGFNITNISQTRSEYFRALASATADMVITRWIADYSDPDTFFHGLLHTEKGIVGRVCGTPEMDRLIEQGRKENDPEMRHEIYREAEEVIARKALLLPLFHEQAYCFARPEVEGFQVAFSRSIVPYEKLWIHR